MRWVSVVLLVGMWWVQPCRGDSMSLLGLVSSQAAYEALRRGEQAVDEVRGFFPSAPRQEPQIEPHHENGVAWRGDQVYPVSAPAGADVFRVENVLLGYDEERSARSWVCRPILKTKEFHIDEVLRVEVLANPLEPRELASHVAIMFEFKRSSFLVVSAEARMKSGERLTLSKALSGEVPLIHVLETRDAFWRSVALWGSPTVERHRLKMDAHEARGALRTALEMALADHSKQRYHLLNNSCVTNAARVINGGLRPERRFRTNVLPGVVPRARVSISSWFPEYLRSNGYLDEPTR